MGLRQLDGESIKLQLALWGTDEENLGVPHPVQGALVILNPSAGSSVGFLNWSNEGSPLGSPNCEICAWVPRDQRIPEQAKKFCGRPLIYQCKDRRPQQQFTCSWSLWGEGFLGKRGVHRSCRMPHCFLRENQVQHVSLGGKEEEEKHAFSHRSHRSHLASCTFRLLLKLFERGNETSALWVSYIES